MESNEKEMLAGILAELIRTHPAVHKALLDWATFNPYINCKE